MKIAVTLASGQLGSTIVKTLSDEVGKENVVGIARTPAKAEHLGVECRKGDYNSRQDLIEALQGIDTAVVISSISQPEKRIRQHQNIIEAAKSNGVRKIVYSSIIGQPDETAFSPIVESNRQTEEDIKNSGLHWVIGRNSIYIEPDLEYVEEYKKEGGIINCAAEGKCAYTSRDELARAYTKILTEDHHRGNTYQLAGKPITQRELANTINEHFGTNLRFFDISVEEFTRRRTEALGDFYGPIVGGIYHGIRLGHFDVPSSFERVVGRPHKSPREMVAEFKENQG